MEALLLMLDAVAIALLAYGTAKRERGDQARLSGLFAYVASAAPARSRRGRPRRS